MVVLQDKGVQKMFKGLVILHRHTKGESKIQVQEWLIEGDTLQVLHHKMQDLAKPFLGKLLALIEVEEIAGVICVNLQITKPQILPCKDLKCRQK